MGSSCSTDRGADPNVVAQVQQLIQSNAVIVFAKTTCPYCAATKLLLKKKGVNYTAVNVDTTSGGSAMHSALKDMTQQRTVPNIFIGQQHIGGNSEIQAMNKRGELDQALRAVGAVR